MSDTYMRHEDTEAVHFGDSSCGDKCRPVAVIDPEDGAQIQRLRELFDKHWGPTFDLASVLREYANPTLLRPAEPQGLGAVVEDTKGSLWVKTAKGWSWVHATGMYANAKHWDDCEDPVRAVRVLFEGVTA